MSALPLCCDMEVQAMHIPLSSNHPCAHSVVLKHLLDIEEASCEQSWACLGADLCSLRDPSGLFPFHDDLDLITGCKCAPKWAR